VADADGQQVVNTLRPYGAPLPKDQARPELRPVALRGRQAARSPTCWNGPVAGKPVITVGTPIMVKGKSSTSCPTWSTRLRSPRSSVSSGCPTAGSPPCWTTPQGHRPLAPRTRRSPATWRRATWREPQAPLDRGGQQEHLAGRRADHGRLYPLAPDRLDAGGGDSARGPEPARSTARWRSATGSSCCCWCWASPCRWSIRAASTPRWVAWSSDAGPSAGRALPRPIERHLEEIAAVHAALRAASRELKAREERQGVMINELNHRVKNTLATVQALARQTFAKTGRRACRGVHRPADRPVRRPRPLDPHRLARGRHGRAGPGQPGRHVDRVDR
jgi:hypothetical protein